MKTVISAISAIALVASVSATPVAANKESDDVAKALAGVIAAGVLGAAIAKHQHERGDEEYTPHPKVHADENAIGRCMHKSLSTVKKGGGYDLELEHVKSVKAASDGSTRVEFVATGYYPTGHKTSDILCVVKNGKVTSLKHN